MAGCYLDSYCFDSSFDNRHLGYSFGSLYLGNSSDILLLDDSFDTLLDNLHLDSGNYSLDYFYRNFRIDCSSFSNR